VEDLLEPDYEGLKKLSGVTNHFKKTFLDGHSIDPDCQEKPKVPRSKAKP
jgi:hypothetical protein